MEEFIKNITRQAGAAVLEQFGKIGVKYTKENPGDVVTEADLIANKIIVDAIKQKYPDHGIISEEMPAYQKDAQYIWMIDPIDGTRNFATGTPLFGVMVAVAKNKQLELATIFNPATDEFYFAKRNAGAFRNNQPIHCAATPALEHSFGCFNAVLIPKKIPFFKSIVRKAEQSSFWVSGFGATAVSAYYVADARRDWYITGGTTVWDFAAPMLLLAEAGCVVTNLKGEPWQLHHTEFIAANPKLHPQILAMMQNQL